MFFNLYLNFVMKTSENNDLNTFAYQKSIHESQIV